MKSIKIILILVLIGSIGTLCAGGKKDSKTITVDGKACLKMENENLASYTVFDIEGNEICFVKYISESPYYNGAYQKIVFPDDNGSMTMASMIFTKKKLVNALIDNEIVVDCKYESENVGNFIRKYDEAIENSSNKVIIIKE